MMFLLRLGGVERDVFLFEGLLIMASVDSELCAGSSEDGYGRVGGEEGRGGGRVCVGLRRRFWCMLFFSIS